jgi:hypothetical protein
MRGGKNMKATFKDREYSTFDAHCVGYRHIGEFGHSDGFEEQLYVAADGQYFLFGNGGPDSQYCEPEINLLTEEEAVRWKKRTAM